MSTELNALQKFSLSRRNLLQASGALIVTAAGPLPFLASAHAQQAAEPARPAAAPPLTTARSSWPIPSDS